MTRFNCGEGGLEKQREIEDLSRMLGERGKERSTVETQIFITLMTPPRMAELNVGLRLPTVISNNQFCPSY